MTDKEEQCSFCGDQLCKKPHSRATAHTRTVSGWTNTVFLAALGFTAYWFFIEQKVTLPVALAISCALILLRILAEWVVQGRPAKR
jgi:hypothetical protein